MRAPPSISRRISDSTRHSTKRLAIVAFILSVVGLFPLALFFGYMAKRRLEQSAEQQTPATLAVIAITLGWLEFAYIAIWMLILATTGA